MTEKKYTLLTSQRNAIFRLIQDSKLSPADFYWDEITSQFDGMTQIPALRHSPTEYSCCFECFQSNFVLHFSPGRDTQSDSVESKEWQHILRLSDHGLGT